jgi:hypothetical protein
LRAEQLQHVAQAPLSIQTLQHCLPLFFGAEVVLGGLETVVEAVEVVVGSSQTPRTRSQEQTRLILWVAEAWVQDRQDRRPF